MSDVEQIYYSNWNQKLMPGHENYFEIISTIAEWIGFSMEGSILSSSRYRVNMSTIGVSQAKEKFGQCRVYVNFAVNELVRKEFEKNIKMIRKKNEDFYLWESAGRLPAYAGAWLEKEYLSKKYPIDEPSFESFYERCLIRDCKWYRRIYMQSFLLWPQYKAAIFSGANYQKFLFDKESELVKYFSNDMHCYDENKHNDDLLFAKKISEFKKEPL